VTDDETTQVPDELLEALAELEGVEGPAAERATDDGMPTGMDLEARAEADPRSRIELIVAIDAVEAQRDEYLDDLRRSHADFENYRKRVARDGAIQREHGRSDVVTVLLDVLDDLDRVVAAADALTDTHAAEVTAVASGVRVVAEKAQRVLEGLGIERVDAAGVPFDPTVHDAVQQVDSERADGAVEGSTDGGASGPMVHTVLRPGYRSAERVLRPAMVVVEQ
jgi:molecular chaperone GrpE